MTAEEVIQEAIIGFSGSLQALAYRSGVSKSYISRIKNGHSKRIGDKKRRQLADALKIPDSAFSEERMSISSIENHPILGSRFRRVVMTYSGADVVSRQWIERLLDIAAEQVTEHEEYATGTRSAH